MKEMLPYSLIGLIVCCAMALITYGDIRLEGPSEPYATGISLSLLPKPVPLVINNWSLWFQLEDELKYCDQLVKIQEAHLEIERLRTSQQAAKSDTTQNSIQDQKIQENDHRIDAIRDRVKEIDKWITQKIIDKKVDENALEIFRNTVERKTSKGLSSGYTDVDMIAFSNKQKRVDETDANISILQEEKDKLNRELGNLK
jgi:hypothetical protein